MKRRNLLQLAAASACGFALDRNARAQSSAHVPGSSNTVDADSLLDGSAPSSPPTLSIGKLVVGKGRPKIVIPITGASPQEAMQMAGDIAKNRNGDLAEFRIDYQKGDLDPQQIAKLCADLRQALGDKPLLATYRTHNEGGMRAIPVALYEDLYQAILKKKASQLVDIEMMIDAPRRKRLIDFAHQQQVAVIISNHNFNDTPPSSVLLARLKRQQAMGADILKIATMPKTPGDTLRLMEVTWRMYSAYAKRPLLTMAMGPEGVVSRLTGELTGSSMSYGSLGSASAPGQLKADDLEVVLGVIHGAAKG